MFQMIAGLDIGNGYIKGKVSDNDMSFMTGIDIPSAYAYVTSTYDVKTPDAEAGDVIKDIYNNMDVSFESPLVKDKNRRLFGERGIRSGNVVDEFDVYSSISKAKQPISYMLTLGCLAGSALQAYWNENHFLPTEPIDIDVRVALALPIGEFKKYRKEYADNYKQSVHSVIFYNFEIPVRVNITISDVQVIAEGASAQYAIRDKGEAFMDSMLANIRSMGEPLPGITANDILSASNIVGIDIGEGTVNFPVFQAAEGKVGGKFNPDVSLTFDKGYGAVLNAALERLQDAGYPFGSRKALQSFLNTQPNALNRGKYAAVKATVDDEIVAFVTEVGMQFSKIMQRVGIFTEVVYVYGGGATPVKPELYPVIIEKAKSFGAGELPCPILYLDSQYSRYLNREGLYTIAKKYADMQQ